VTYNECTRMYTRTHTHTYTLLSHFFERVSHNYGVPTALSVYSDSLALSATLLMTLVYARVRTVGRAARLSDDGEICQQPLCTIYTSDICCFITLTLHMFTSMCNLIHSEYDALSSHVPIGSLQHVCISCNKRVRIRHVESHPTTDALWRTKT
jgi:hypothetical protein